MDAMMQHHRNALRAQADLPITVHADGYGFECRTVDLSPRGVRVGLASGLRHHTARPIYLVEFSFGDAPAIVLARPAWWTDSEAGLRFVAISDWDRLSLAEQMDASVKVGLALC